MNRENFFILPSFGPNLMIVLYMWTVLYYYYKNVNLSLICEPVVKIGLPVYDPSILYISLFIKHSSQAA